MKYAIIRVKLPTVTNLKIYRVIGIVGKANRAYDHLDFYELKIDAVRFINGKETSKRTRLAPSQSKGIKSGRVSKQKAST